MRATPRPAAPPRAPQPPVPPAPEAAADAGVNHVPSIGGVARGAVRAPSVVADAALVATGALAIVDADPGEAAFRAQAGTPGRYGVFTLAPSGAWTYATRDSEPSVQALPGGARLTDSFAAVSLDGSASRTVTVTIVGANHAPLIGGDAWARLRESAAPGGATLSAAGALTIADLNQGESHFVAQPQAAGRYGRFALAEDGRWSYAVADDQPAIQALPAGAALVDSFVARSADGSAGRTVRVQIVGANHVPQIGGDVAGAVRANAGVSQGALTATGALTIADLNQGESAFRPQAAQAGRYGAFSLAADGAWSYTADNAQAAIQRLSGGATLTDSFAAVSADGSATQAVTVTIHARVPALYVFGTSLSDVGNSYALSAGRIPVSPPYAQGRFCNGPIWVDTIAGYLGLTIGPSFQGGTDFAVGGATTGAPGVAATGHDLTDQIAAFDAAVPAPSPDAAFVVDIGANDLIKLLGTGFHGLDAARALALQSAQTEAALVAHLVADGARNVIVFGVANLGLTPLEANQGAAQAQLATDLTDTYNTAVQQALAALPGLGDARVAFIEPNAILDQIVADPQAYGMDNATSRVWTGNPSSPASGVLLTTDRAAQDRYLFWDSLHPTEAGQAFIAASVRAALFG